VTYERQGVHLEQCRDCRGIWLDRGELDRLIDAEAAFVEAPAYQAPSRQDSAQARWDDDDDRRRRDWDDDDDDDDDGRRRRDDDDDYRGRPSRRRSMFGELFEGLIE
jgi:Zn-finger nucleic acid-binding protein